VGADAVAGNFLDLRQAGGGKSKQDEFFHRRLENSSVAPPTSEVRLRYAQRLG
jgi:hypothetical protein